MTDTQIVRIAIDQQEDRIIPWDEINVREERLDIETAERHQILEFVLWHLDMTYEQLQNLVYGDKPKHEVVVGINRENQVFTLRPETRLG